MASREILLATFVLGDIMDRKEFNITVPMKSNYNQVVRGLYVGDKGAVFNLRFAQDGEVFNFDGECTVIPQIRKPNGTWYASQACINDLDGNGGLVSIYLPDECVAQEGMYLLKVGFYFYGSASQTAGVNFYVESLDNVSNEDVESQTELPVFNEMIQSFADYVSHENDRQSAEAQREFNELERQARLHELELAYQRMKQLYDSFIEAVAQSKDVVLSDWTTKEDFQLLSEKLDATYQIYYGSSAPENTKILWLDNDGNLKAYVGTEWQTVKTVPIFGGAS